MSFDEPNLMANLDIIVWETMRWCPIDDTAPISPKNRSPAHLAVAAPDDAQGPTVERAYGQSRATSKVVRIDGEVERAPRGV